MQLVRRPTSTSVLVEYIIQMKRMRNALLFWWVSSVVCVKAQNSSDGYICSICPASLPVVGLPNVVLPAGTAGAIIADTSCAAAEQMAQQGLFSQGQCVLLRSSGVSDTCGCDTGVAVTGSVSIRLVSTSSELEGSIADTYLEICQVFYLEQFSAKTVYCAFSARRLNIQHRSHSLRVLQSNVTLSPIVVTTGVTSLFAAGNEIGNYNQALIDAIDLNGEEFAFYLRTRGTAASQEYFATVQTVDAFRSTVAPVPVSSPTIATAPVAPPNSGGRSLTAILLVGVAVGMVFTALIAYFVIRSQQRKSSSPPSGESPPPVHTTTASIVSSSFNAPLVSAIPVRASVDPPQNVAENEHVHEAVPMTASVRDSTLTYKDQAREHPDAVAVPQAVPIGAHLLTGDPSDKM